MIRIHLSATGQTLLTGTEDAVTLRQPQDYIRVRVAIRDAMRSNADLNVIVLSSICEAWFWDLDRLPSVEIINDDPVTVLRRKLQVPSLPAEISEPALIVGLRLAELPAPENPGTDLLAWVAQHKLGEAWSVDQPSFAHLSQLVAWLACNHVPQVIEAIADKRMQLWLTRATGILLDGYRAVQQNADKAVPFLCCWRMLRVYDEELRAQWLEEAGWYVKELRAVANNLNELPLSSSVQKTIAQKVEPHWRRRLKEMDQEAVA